MLSGTLLKQFRAYLKSHVGHKWFRKVEKVKGARDCVKFKKYKIKAGRLKLLRKTCKSKKNISYYQRH